MQEVRTSETESEGILRAELVRKIRKNSCSCRNFSAKLNVLLFDKDTRKRSNVAGKMGKLKLNPTTSNLWLFNIFPWKEVKARAVSGPNV